MEQIIVEILLSLPVKSLLRFKCVSKGWFSEISSSEFAKTQFIISSKNKRIHSHYRLLCSITPFPYICSFDEQIPPIPLHHNFTNWGCCNGWICYSKEIYTKPMLWNPSTRKFLQFRASDAYKEAKGKQFWSSVITYGFGYDEFTDDYKVIEIVDPKDKCILSIYSVRRNIWKRLTSFVKSLGEYCYLLNGSLHWETYHKYKWRDCPSSILSINLSKETYQEFDFPKHEEFSSEQMDTRIGVLKDCLCASFNYFFSQVDVWIMKEYGTKESWYKFVSIPHILVTGHKCMQLCSPPIWLFESGEILLIHEYKMKTYNPKDGNFKRCFGADDEWRKRNIDPDQHNFGNGHNLYKQPECYVQNLYKRPECYVQSLMNLPYYN